MKNYWGIDFGTTNTKLARWDEANNSPVMVRLPRVARESLIGAEIDVSYSIPSALWIKHRITLRDILSRNRFFRGIFGGAEALIGTQTGARDHGGLSKNYAEAFKPLLAESPFAEAAVAGGRSYSARAVSELFLRELVAQAERETGERPYRVCFSAPVDSYETYRAELKAIAARIGIAGIKIIDEPVAAAIGYGMSVEQPQTSFVIDFGGGTLDVALVAFGGHKPETGRCDVIAKAGLAIGGNTVDRWIAESFAIQRGYNIRAGSRDPEIRLWFRLLCGEAQRVKEALYFNETETFYLTPPEEHIEWSRRLYAKHRHLDEPLDFTRLSLIKLLQQRGLYRAFNGLLDGVMLEAKVHGIAKDKIREVLMVGGSTLLPNIYRNVERRFGRDRVRAWQPFDAVAAGNTAFARGALAKTDFIIHDYVFVTHNFKNNVPEYNVVVPAGTKYPTADDFWKQRLVPTCALGEPERVFKLLICEIGKKGHAFDDFIFDETGRAHKLSDGNGHAIIVSLNQEDQVFGHLSPPHQPGDRKARLEIRFMVNEDRWLCATVRDILTRRMLMNKKPVVRLR